MSRVVFTANLSRHLPAPELGYDLAIQAPHIVVACPSSPDTLWSQHHNGVFRSKDGGHVPQENRHGPAGPRARRMQRTEKRDAARPADIVTRVDNVEKH